MSDSIAPISRGQILAALRAALEPLGYAHAMWGSSAAFGRVDQWEDSRSGEKITIGPKPVWRMPR